MFFTCDILKDVIGKVVQYPLATNPQFESSRIILNFNDRTKKQRINYLRLKTIRSTWKNGS